MTEQEKMLKGMIYNPSDKSLVSQRDRAHTLCNKFNNLIEESDPLREKIIDELIPDHNNVCLLAPIHFDYGRYTSFGKNCFANFNLTVLDCCPVKIGDNVFMGPNVSLMTPVHPFLASERNMYLDENGELVDIEYAKPITIEDNCWLASNVIVCGGVTIGHDSVIGAGSVVTRNIPPHSLAAGNPCKVIREITEKDSVYLKKNLFE